MHLKSIMCFRRVIVNNGNNGLSQSSDVDVQEQLSAS